MNGTDSNEPKGRKRAESLVYGAFFGLDDDPFRVTPDPRFMYKGEGREAVAERFLAHVRAPEGLSLVTGGAGSGKSLVLRWLMSQLSPQQPVAMIWHASLSRDDFLAAICGSMEVDSDSLDLDARIAALHDKSVEAGAGGLIPVILLDEANSLQTGVLDLIPRLLGVKAVGAPLVSVVMSVDSAARNRFLEAVEAPIGCEWALDPLSPDEVTNYVRHRLDLAGGDGEYLFEPKALERVAALSGGVPRVINTLCGKALLLAYLGDEHKISARTIDEVRRELWVSEAKHESSEGPSGASLPERMARGQMSTSESTSAAESVSDPFPEGDETATLQKSSDRVGPFVVAASENGKLRPNFRSARPRDTESEAKNVTLIGGRKGYRSSVFGTLVLLVILGSAFMVFGPGRGIVEQAIAPAIDLVRRESAPITQRHEALGISQSQLSSDVVTPRSPGDPVAANRAPDSIVSRAGEPPRGTSPAGSTSSESGVAGPAPADPALVAGDLSNAASQSLRGAVKDEREQAELTERRVRSLMVEAVRHVNARRFVEPAGRNALDSYRHVLTLEPDNRAAQSGIRSIRDRFVRWARVAESREDWATARDYYKVALQVGPVTPDLEAAMATAAKNSP